MDIPDEILQHGHSNTFPGVSLEQKDELSKKSEKKFERETSSKTQLKVAKLTPGQIKKAADKYRKNARLQKVVTTPSASYTKQRVRQGTYPNGVKRKRTESFKPTKPKPKVNEVIDDLILPGLLN